MAIPDAVRQSQREYMERQNLADLGTCKAVRRKNSLYGVVPADVRRSFDIEEGDELRIFADFQHDVLFHTPSDLARSVGGDRP